MGISLSESARPDQDLEFVQALEEMVARLRESEKESDQPSRLWSLSTEGHVKIKCVDFVQGSYFTVFEMGLHECWKDRIDDLENQLRAMRFPK